MKIKDINLVEVEIIQNGQVVYSGEVNNAPDNIKQLVCKNNRFESNRLIIEVE